MLRFSGLLLEPFLPFFGKSEGALAAEGIRRVVADENPGYPCRITLQEAELGETLLLMAYLHQRASSPYRASGPIFVREMAREPFRSTSVPPVLRNRLLSLRAYDAADMIVDADVIAGNEVEAALERMFERPELAYVHIHNAKRGCFSCRVDRA
jgi:hypothetical protein